MKKRLLAVIVAAVIMITIPLFTVKNNAFEDIKKSFISKNEIKADKLTEILAYNFKEEYSDEGMKAIALILNSNYKAKSKLKSITKKAFVKKHGNNYYSKLEKTVKEINGGYITYKGKPARIPCCYISDGSCETSLPYIRKTANPWDLLNKSYKKGVTRSKVSLNSLNELCERGLSCKEALSRYLKGVKITASKRGGQ